MPPEPTERLRFREMIDRDFDSLDAMFADDYARAIYPRMADPGEVRGWIDWNERNYAQDGYGLWVIETHEGTFIGDCGLTWQQAEHGLALEIGYHVTADERGKGYALEAARACLAHGFATTEAPMICSIVLPANRASISVARRLHAAEKTFTKPDGRELLLFWTGRPSA